MKYLSALSACILGSLRIKFAIDLVLLLVRTLVEGYLNMNGAPRAFMVLTIFALTVLSGLRRLYPAKFGVAAASNDSQHLVPVAIREAAFPFGAAWIADRFQTFDMPLVLFFQTLLHKLTS